MTNNSELDFDFDHITSVKAVDAQGGELVIFNAPYDGIHLGPSNTMTVTFTRNPDLNNVEVSTQLENAVAQLQATELEVKALRFRLERIRELVEK